LKQRSDSGEVAEGEAQRSLRRASKNSNFRSTRDAARAELKAHLPKGAHEEVRWQIGRHRSAELAGQPALPLS